ncbi:MAG: hypothetical protein M0T79_03900 [Actinomycetota bacterium]|nr:hypothetical protein [Actinomycetota bacterium]
MAHSSDTPPSAVTRLEPGVQQVLIVQAASKSPVSSIVGWALYDGRSPSTAQMRTGAEPTPPYATVVDALGDGWRLLRVPDAPLNVMHEHELGPLAFEFVLTRVVADA